MGILDDAIREHLELKRQHGAGEDEVKQKEAEAFGPARQRVAEAPIAEEAAAAELQENPTEFLAPPAEEPGSEFDTAFADEAAPPAAEEPVPGSPAPFSEPPEYADTRIAGAPSDYGDVESPPMADPAQFADVPPVEQAPPPQHHEEPHPMDEHDLRGQEQAPEPVFRTPEASSPAAPEAPIAPPVEEPPVQEPVEEPPVHEPPVDEPPVRDEQAPEGDDEDVLEETPEFLQDAPEHDRLWFEQKPPRDFDFGE
jgi:hypothetical protein